MKLDTLIRDPIFQLNLLLWMARDQPEDAARVTPLFYRWGYRFVMVESPVPLPQEIVVAIKNAGLDSAVNPEPEMILGHTVRQDALYLEAKKESFSVKSTTARQARGHLLAAGDVFKSIVTPYQTARLCYVLPEDRRSLMETCLSSLIDELKSQRLNPARTSVHGLEVSDAGVIYRWDDDFSALVGAGTKHELILQSEGDETDPSPLLLVYSAEDYDGGTRPDYAREAMLKQVWAHLLCMVQVSEAGVPLAVKADAILTFTTDGIFNYLGQARQKSLCRLVSERLFAPIRDHWDKADNRRDDIQVALNGSVLTITLKDSHKAKINFTDWLEEEKKVRPDYSALSKVEPLAFDFDKQIP